MSTANGGGADAGGSGPLYLVTGATGYIGGRLVPELLAAGFRVRALARSPGRLRDHPWAGEVEVVKGDVTDPASLGAAMEGVDIAYYLVHALTTGPGFERTDREAARVFGERARAADVRRLVYLGGLAPQGCPSGNSRRICGPGPRWAGSCSTPGCPRPRCAPR